MQGRDEYEADYYGGAPFWQENERRGMRQDMPWGDVTQPQRMPEGSIPWPGTMPGRPISLGRTCCQGRINELLEEMERSLGMQSEEVRRIAAEIRKVCGSIDGRGCMAIEGEPDREMMDMLLEQVMDRLNWMSEIPMESHMGNGRRDGMETGIGEAEAAGHWTEDGWNWYRDLVETLIWQELLRRKMRRRMPGQRRY